MQNKLLGEAITFDDVLLAPRLSKVLPRDVDVSSRLTKSIALGIPLVSSPMDTVTEGRLAAALARQGGIGIIHKNLSVEAQCIEIDGLRQENLRVGAAVDTGDHERVAALVRAGADVILIDSAHGHSENVLATLREIRRQYGSALQIIAGNIATAEAAYALIEAGADCLRVGIGPGSICTTRIVAGVGVPQITAIMNVVPVAEAAGIPVIADGGIRHSGDVVKALAAGADSVMMGSLLAGVDESPGRLIEVDGQRYKEYRGMGSVAAMAAGGGDRYGQPGRPPRAKLVPEGVEGRVPYHGPLSDYVYQLIGGLRAGMGYCGTATIADLKRDARFYRITPAGMAESHPHNIVITQEAPNYGKTTNR